MIQEAAAERLGITQCTLSRIETGKLPYNQDFLEQAAKVYNCTAIDLIGRNPFDTSAYWAIFETLNKLPKHRQTDAARIIRALADNGTDE